jgi:hypothetical protein
MVTDGTTGWLLKAIVRKTHYTKGMVDYKRSKHDFVIIAFLWLIFSFILWSGIGGKVLDTIKGLILKLSYVSVLWVFWIWLTHMFHILLVDLITGGAVFSEKRGGVVYHEHPTNLIGTFHIPDANIIESGSRKITFERVYPNGSKTICFFEGSQILHLERTNDVTKYAFEPDPRDPRVYTGTDCAITTATTIHIPQHSNQMLSLLQGFRNEWLESFRLGCRLSRLYTLWGPPIAKWLPTKPRFSNFILRIFIQPCARRLAIPDNGTLSKVGVMIWYAVGALFCKVAYEIG